MRCCSTWNINQGNFVTLFIFTVRRFHVKEEIKARKLQHRPLVSNYIIFQYLKAQVAITLQASLAALNLQYYPNILMIPKFKGQCFALVRRGNHRRLAGPSERYPAITRYYAVRKPTLISQRVKWVLKILFNFPSQHFSHQMMKTS